MTLNFPSKFQRTRISASITSNPVAAMDTRKNAVGTVPITGAMMRINKKLAPQMPANDSIRTISASLTVVSLQGSSRAV